MLILSSESESESEDRISKASRVSHMILQALRTNRNVSPKLTMNLFDKQITSILLYGSSVWSTPKTFDMFYVEQQPEHLNTRTIVTNMLSSVMKRNVAFEYARRVGKGTPESPRKILVKLREYTDKLELFRSVGSSSYIISNVDEKDNNVEKFHHEFCKKSLNVCKLFLVVISILLPFAKMQLALKCY